MKIKLLFTFTAALCAAFPLSGTIYDVFRDIENAFLRSTGPVRTDDSAPQLHLEDLPDDMSHEIAKHMLAARPELNQLKTYKKINAGRDIRSVVWNPKGTEIVSSSHDGSIKTWNAATGAELQLVQEKSANNVNRLSNYDPVTWSPDGTRLASGSEYSPVIIWDTNTWQELQTLQGHTKHVSAVAWSPDGTKLASGSEEKIILWDTNTWQPLQTLRCHRMPYAVVWSRDGTKLASGSWKKIIIWDTTTWQQSQKLRGHKDTVSSVAFSFSGARIVSGSYDGSVIIWDPNTGQPLQTLRSLTGAVSSVAWSPNGTKLASSSYDGSIIIWNFAPLLSGHDQDNITLEQVLFLMLLHTKRPSFDFTQRNPPIDFNRPLHDKLLAHEAQAVLDSFDPVSKANIIKRYNIIQQQALAQTSTPAQASVIRGSIHADEVD